MKFVTLNPNEETQAKLTGYIYEDFPDIVNRSKRPAIVICPGGGYRFCSKRENESVATFFLAKGFSVFVLEYSVTDVSEGNEPLYFKPLQDLSKSIMLIRENAEEWCIDTTKIAVCGFSAGGHLAASMGILHDIPELGAVDFNNRPDAMVLCYPVITMRDFTHKGSRNNLTGENKEYMDRFALEELVNENTTPAFIWHTMTDETVPVANSIDLTRAMLANGVDVETHLYGKGPHGTSMCNYEVNDENPHNATWANLAFEWLCDRFDFKA